MTPIHALRTVIVIKSKRTKVLPKFPKPDNTHPSGCDPLPLCVTHQVDFVKKNKNLKFHLLLPNPVNKLFCLMSKAGASKVCNMACGFACR